MLLPTFLFGGYMNVRISYTIDISEVPDRVRVLLTEAYSSLQPIVDSKNIPLNKNNVLDTLERIKSAREKMLTVDTQLVDCYNILAGYNKALAEAAMPQQESAEQNVESTDSQ